MGNSRFDLFILIEDTVKGIITFAIKFIKTTLYFCIRPRKILDRFIDTEAPDYETWPRPYTFISIWFFIFFYVSELILYEHSLSGFSEVNMIGLYDVSALERNIKDISVLRLLLVTLPATAVVTIIKYFILALSGQTDQKQKIITSHVVYYAFGSQFFLYLISLFLTSRLSIPFASPLITLPLGILKLIFTAYAIILPTVILSKWFSRVEVTRTFFKKKIIKIPLFIMCSFAIIFSVMTLSDMMSDRLKRDVSINIVDTETAEDANGLKLKMKVVFNNRSDSKYLIKNKPKASLFSSESQKLIFIEDFHFENTEDQKYLQLGRHGMIQTTAAGYIPYEKIDKSELRKYYFSIEISDSIVFKPGGEKANERLSSKLEQFWRLQMNY